jgi:hypothetical protein
VGDHLAADMTKEEIKRFLDEETEKAWARYNAMTGDELVAYTDRLRKMSGDPLRSNLGGAAVGIIVGMVVLLALVIL